MGIHEPNFQVVEEFRSPAKYYFRVHMDVKLGGETEAEKVRSALKAGKWKAIRDIVKPKVKDKRAKAILGQVKAKAATGARK